MDEEFFIRKKKTRKERQLWRNILLMFYEKREISPLEAAIANGDYGLILYCLEELSLSINVLNQEGHHLLQIALKHSTFLKSFADCFR